MTAKEAKAKAAAFDSIKDNIIYKKIEKLIETNKKTALCYWDGVG